MGTIIVEDGSTVPNANSYVAVTDLVTYAAQQGVTLPATEAEQETLLYKAMTYLEQQNYSGVKADYAQALEWPRTGANDNGYVLDSDEIPVKLKKAQMQLALEAITTNLTPNIVASTKGAVVEETVIGAVSVKYAQPVNPGMQPVFTVVNGYLDGLLASTGLQARVRRA